jgi:hypothetical protein
MLGSEIHETHLSLKKDGDDSWQKSSSTDPKAQEI